MNLKDENELVSILIPTYERYYHTSAAIDSALQQTYGSIEIIVSDNNSKDGSFEKLLGKYSKYDRVKFVKNKCMENTGPVANWISAFNSSSGDYIKFLWSDDLISPEFIENTLPLLRRDNVAFVYTPVIFFKDEIPKSNFFNVAYKNYAFSEYISIENYLKKLVTGGNIPHSPGSALFRRADIKLTKNIPRQCNITADYYKTGAGIDLLMFLNCLSIKKYTMVAVTKKPYSYFRSHKSSLTIEYAGILKYNYIAVIYNTVINLNDKKLIRLFKTYLFFENRHLLNSGNIKSIYNNINCQISYLDFCKLNFFSHLYLFFSKILSLTKKIKKYLTIL